MNLIPAKMVEINFKIHIFDQLTSIVSIASENCN